MNEEKVIYSHAKMIFPKLLSRIKGENDPIQIQILDIKVQISGIFR